MFPLFPSFTQFTPLFPIFGKYLLTGGTLSHLDAPTGGYATVTSYVDEGQSVESEKKYTSQNGHNLFNMG